MLLAFCEYASLNSNPGLIILIMVYFMFFNVEFLLSLEHTSCTLLDPLTDKRQPTMKLFIIKITCFFVYNSGDRII